MSEQEKMLTAYDLVINRFTHTDQAKYTVFSNWVLWLMGKVSSPFSYIRDPEILVAKGHSAICSQQAYLLQILAEAIDIRTRAVGLNGHVVMEAWYENDWHLFDPDLELVPLLDNKRILSLDELARSPELIRQLYAGRGDEEYVNSIVKIIATREDNSFSSYPKLVQFEWKTMGLFHFEKISNVMKWIIPTILLLLGLGLYFKNRREV